ncbi:MAG: transposase zinc-binding domain-containing protein [Acidobacteriia bacterium]|nr:transposase zinc-binding domain-containing protein [Terriglobia bacterium]
MRIRFSCVTILGLTLVMQLQAQAPSLPQTYSFVANSNMMGQATIKVNRNGSKELVEVAGASGNYHLRQLYDFQAHRVYTIDLNVNQCTSQEYTSDYAPALHDPIGGASEMAKEAGSLRTIGREAVNGTAARLVEAPLEGSQGKYRIWLDEKFGFPVKQAVILGAEPEKLLFEMRQISYAPSAATLFTAPAQCTRVGGVTSATGGSAEMAVDVTVQGQARQHGPAYRQAHSLPLHQHRLMQALETCRTAVLGGSVEWCDHCQSHKYSITAFLSPDGKSLTQGRWVEAASGNGAWSAASNTGAQPETSETNAAPGKVTAVRLRLVPERYTGPCPSGVQLVGQVSTDGPGRAHYEFLAGAVKMNGPSEGTLTFNAAGTQTVTLSAEYVSTPQVPEALMLAVMQNADGTIPPQNESSEPVNYNATCRQAPAGRR